MTTGRIHVAIKGDDRARKRGVRGNFQGDAFAVGLGPGGSDHSLEVDRFHIGRVQVPAEVQSLQRHDVGSPTRIDGKSSQRRRVDGGGFVVPTSGHPAADDERLIGRGDGDGVPDLADRKVVQSTERGAVGDGENASNHLHGRGGNGGVHRGEVPGGGVGEPGKGETPDVLERGPRDLHVILPRAAEIRSRIDRDHGSVDRDRAAIVPAPGTGAVGEGFLHGIGGIIPVETDLRPFDGIDGFIEGDDQVGGHIHIDGVIRRAERTADLRSGKIVDALQGQGDGTG